MANTLPSQIKISTTLPSLKHLSLPTPDENTVFFFKLFLADDLDSYKAFLKEPLISFGRGNPAFDLSNTENRFQRILEDSVAQGIHMGFFLKRGDRFEVVGEGGVYMPESGWPSIYWTRRDLEMNDGEWKSEIPRSIHAFWWSLPRNNTQLLVNPASLLQDSQGRPQSLELLCAHGIHNDGNILSDFAEYEKSQWRSWGSISVSSTLPALKYIHHSIPSSSRLVYRTLSLADGESWYSIRKQHNTMKNLGVGKIDPDLRYSQGTLNWMLTPRDHHFPFLMGIFLKDPRRWTGGEMIGYLGVRLFTNGWPTVHYALKEEHQGKQYGSEFLETFVQYWSSLPRKKVNLQVDHSTLDFPPANAQVPERLEAITETWNLASQGILRKSGFLKLDTPGRQRYYWHFRAQ